MIKLLTVLIATLFGQDSYLVKQGDIVVPLEDLDAYVYQLNDRQKGGFAMKTMEIEKNIYTLLNVNIIYQHIMESKLNELKQFKDVSNEINNRDFVIDEVFFDKLKIDSDLVIQSYKKYVLKLEYYKLMLKYLVESEKERDLTVLAKERFIINKNKYVVPEKRDLSVIMVDPTNENDVITNSIISNLQSRSIDDFHTMATEISIDRSVKSNNGHWGEFRKKDFNYAFVDVVFNSNVGIIPHVLVDKGKKYIVRINSIKEKTTPIFGDNKDQIIKEIRSNSVTRKFQKILNANAFNKIEVNPELLAHVFERYKVFLEE